MPEPEKHHVHLVEDDPAMRQMLCAYLAQNCIEATPMATAEEFMVRHRRTRAELLLLDVSLPGASGLEVCRQLRAEGDRLPIILLTSRSEEIDRVLGLEMGADDYLPKPFSLRELLARIRALLRRASTIPGVPVGKLEVITIGEAFFDLPLRRLRWPDGRKHALATVEFAILAELATHPNIALSRERLLAVSHGSHHSLLPRSIDVSIMRLRRCIEPDLAFPRYIQTVRNHGYMFVPDRIGTDPQLGQMIET